MKFPARYGAGLPGLAAAVDPCGGQHADGRGATGADRGRGRAGLGAAPRPRRPQALHVLAVPLYRHSGQQRYNLLDRAGFAWAEEVAATPDPCLLELHNSGPKFIAAVRRAL